MLALLERTTVVTQGEHRSDFQDVLCRRDYAEHVVARFVQKNQSEYYGGNRSVYI